MTDPVSTGRYRMNTDMLRQMEKISPAGRNTAPAQGNRGTPEAGSFRELLNREIDRSLQFSKHARQRSAQRSIDISPAEMTRLETACDRACEKGIRDALIVTENSAFIVNAPSRTVITVVDRNEMKSNVFTNIDGALFV